MRKLWLELVDLNSAISLSGEASIIDSTLVPSGSDNALRLTRVSTAIKLTDLAGLGYSAELSSSFVEPFGYINTREEITQPSPSGNLNIIRKSSSSGPYELYSDFIRLIQGRRVRLRYSPTGGSYDSAYMMDGIISKLLKGEVKASRLECPFEFRGSAPFYKYASRPEVTVSANSTVAISPTQGELSGYRNAYTFSIKVNTTSASSAVCTVNDADDTALAQLGLTDSLARNDVIVWSSDPEDPRVTLNGNDEIIAGKVNLSKKVFSSLPAGTIKFNSTVAVKVTSTYKTYEWSV